MTTSDQPDDVRRWRTTTRPLMGLFDSFPDPALVSDAVNVTIEPDATEVFEAVSVNEVGTSRQVL